MKTLLLLAAGGLAFWWLTQAKPAGATAAPAAVPGVSLTVIPKPAGAVALLTYQGNTVYRDSAGQYYIQQGSSAYVLPLTQANAKNLIMQYLGV